MESVSAEVHTQAAAVTALQAPTDQDLRVPYYCEENAWRVVYRKMRDQPEDNFFVVFISNPVKNVAMFHQRASDAPDQAVSWDYHVSIGIIPFLTHTSFAASGKCVI